MTVSNVISPLLVSMDRFLIGAMISAEAIAYYATPFEIVTKILLLPSALIAVLFPVFSFEFFRKRDRALIVFSSALKFVLLAIFPVVLVTILFAREGLTMWVDSDFGIQGGRVLQWLAAGVLFNSFALAPFALIQGAGRPDVTAKLHMLELPVYLCILWVLIRKYGIEGAAVAWTMRMGMDALALFMLSDCICSVDREFLSKLSIGIAGEFCLLWMASTVTGFYNKLIFLGTASLIVVVFGWRKFLTPSERKIAKAWVPSLGE